MECRIEIQDLTIVPQLHGQMGTGLNDTLQRAGKYAKLNSSPTRILLKAAGDGGNAPRTGNWFFESGTANPLFKHIPQKGWWKQKAFGEIQLKHGKHVIFSLESSDLRYDASGEVLYLPGGTPWSPTTLRSCTAKAKWVRIGRPLPEWGLNSVWAGVAVKGGLSVALGGEEALVAVINIWDKNRILFFNIFSGKIGLELGASGGVCAVLVTGVDGPAHLDGTMNRGFDFSLTLGVKWRALKTYADALGMGGRALRGLRQLATLKVVAQRLKVDKYVEMGKGLYTTGSLSFRDRGVTLFDVVGGGLQAGIFYYISTTKVLAYGRLNRLAVVKN